MDFKIISEIENPLFNRKEIEGEIHSEVTPSREEVTKIISEKFSAPSETIKIRTIKGKFGQKVFLIVANIYKSKEDKDKIENKKKKDIALEKKSAEVEPAEKEVPPIQEQKSGEKPVVEKSEEKVETPAKPEEEN